MQIKNKKLLEEFKGKPCLICSEPSDPCHILSVGSGGSDEENNLLSLCRKHHRLQHDKGWSYMWKNYPDVKDALKKKGFEMTFMFHRYKLVKK